MKKVLFALLIVLFVAGCSSGETQTEESPPENTVAPTVTFTPEPTLTPTPQPTPLGGSGSINYSGGSTLDQLMTGGFITRQLYTAQSVFSPKWSPDGTKLAFATSNTDFFVSEFPESTKFFDITLYVTDAEEFNPQEIGTYQYPLVAGKKYTPNLYYYNFFEWSPDSSKIAYLNYLSHKEASSRAREVEFGINIVSVDTSESVVVGETTFAWDDMGFVYRPMAWSPDSKLLTFTNYAKDKHGLFIVDPGTLEETQLTTTRFAKSVTWHPGGDYILFIEDPSDGRGIPHPGGMSYNPPDIPITAAPGYLSKYNIAEGTVEHLTGEDVLEPVISPDGSMVAYIDGNRVVALPLDGGDEIEIAYACVYYNAQFNLTWSPDSEVVAFRSAEAYLDGCSFSSDKYGAKVFTLDGAQILFTPNRFGPFAFSPDAHYVAIPNMFGQEIVIGDLFSGDVVKMNENYAAYVDWQPFSETRMAFRPLGSWDSLPVPPLYDDFEGENVDQQLWRLSDPNSRNNFEYEQVDGILEISTKGEIENQDFGLRLTGTRDINSMGAFEASLRIDKNSTGQFAFVKTFVDAYSDSLSWATQCTLSYSQQTPMFSCHVAHTDDGYNTVYRTGSVQVNFDQWYTVRIEFNPETGFVQYLLDGNLIDAYEPEEAGKFVDTGTVFEPGVGVWVSSGQIISYVDDVRITE